LPQWQIRFDILKADIDETIAQSIYLPREILRPVESMRQPSPFRLYQCR
jgi:hypothetical protein